MDDSGYQDVGSTRPLVQQHLRDAGLPGTGVKERSPLAQLTAQCILLFEIILQALSTHDNSRSNERKSLEISLERSYSRMKMWSEENGAADGYLDAILAASRELRRDTRKYIVSISQTLTERLISSVDVNLGEAGNKSVSMLRSLTAAVTDGESENSSSSGFSDSISDSLNNVLEDLKVDTTCLLDLEPLLCNPIVGSGPESAAVLDTTSTAWNPHQPSGDKVRVLFPLDKANYDPYLRFHMQGQKFIDELDGTSLHRTASGALDSASSRFFDSGIGSNLFTEASTYAETAMSYGTGEERRVRAPPLPASGAKEGPELVADNIPTAKMASPLELASSIIDLVQLSASVYFAMVKFHREVKEGESNIGILATQTRNLSGLLQSLALFASSLLSYDAGDFIPDSRDTYIESCYTTLNRIKRRLEKAEGDFNSGRYRKLITGSLKWPFAPEETNALITELSQLRNVLQLAFSAETMSHLLQCLANTDNVAKSVDILNRKLDRKESIGMRVGLTAKREEILRFFLKVDPEDQLQLQDCRIQRQPDTGKWLMERVQTFRNWMRLAGSQIWLSGIPVAGKTMLCGAVVEELLQTQTPSTAVAFFFCDSKNPESQKPVNILATLAVQLAKQADVAFEVLKSYHQELHPHNRIAKPPEIKLMIEVVQAMISHYDQVYIVVDGVDECGPNAVEVIQSLKQLTQGSQVNMVLFSRDEPDIIKELSDSPRIEIAAHTEDLELYVFAQMESRKRLGKLAVKSPELHEHIRRTLVAGANGMFRWVACQLEHLDGLPSDGSHRKSLTDLPSTLFETSDSDSTADSEVIRAREAFENAIVNGQLDVCQRMVDQGHSINGILPSCSYTPIVCAVIERQTHIVDWLVSIGVELMNPVTEKLHPSLRCIASLSTHYLLSTQSLTSLLSLYLWQNLSWYGSILGPLHVAILDNKTEALDVMLKHIRENDHAYREMIDNEIICLPADIVGWRGRSALSILVNEFNHEEALSHDSPWALNMPCGSPLHWAIRKGDLPAMKLLLKNEAEVHQFDSSGRTPLHLAVSSRHPAQIIRELLKAGAGLAEPTGSRIQSLKMGIRNGDLEVVKLLAEADPETLKGVDQYSWDDLIRSAGSAGVYQYLISQGADPLSVDGFKASAVTIHMRPTSSLRGFIFNSGLELESAEDPLAFEVAAAAYASNPGSIRFIKKLFCSLSISVFSNLVNRTKYGRGSPLCLAASTNGTHMVEALIPRGADIDFEGSRYGSALMAACVWGCLDVVRCLVRSGAALCYVNEDGLPRSAVDSSVRHQNVTRWLLVNRHVEQRRLKLGPSQHKSKHLVWGGPRLFKLALPTYMQRDFGESSWDHVRRLQKWKEGLLGSTLAQSRRNGGLDFKAELEVELRQSEAHAARRHFLARLGEE